MSERAALAELAPMFRYPDRFPRSDAPALRPFFEEIASLDLVALQSAYTATFDLAPSCSPYLGDHLFGDEHRRRARLMAGLKARFEPAGGELPDHVAEVFAHAPDFTDDEWRDLGVLVLRPALEKMNASLAASVSPYRHLIAAAARLFEETKP